MLSSKKVLFNIIIFVMAYQTLQATPIFSRQYDMKCHSCHVGVPPSLNETGRDFLRNGMRFSDTEQTTLQRFLDDQNRVIPFGFFAGGVAKSAELTMQTPKGEMKKENDVQNPILTIFASGSLSKNFSTFMGARIAYLEQNQNSSDREFEVIKKKAYLQYNNETTHVARAGILYIYPESSENSGLSDNINIYISPIDRVNLKPLYGLEYSYEMKNGLSFMLAGGKIGESNDEKSMIAGFNYEIGAFNAGVIINNITATDSDAKRAKYTPAEKILGERLSVMVPLEYNFNYGYLNLTGVYEENENLKNTEYKALEASVTMPVFESGSVRLIHTTDNEHQKGYALRYAHILYDHIFLNTNLAKINTKTSKLESVSIGLNLIY